ncbi:MAG: hypothetical protein V1755_05570 [Chloroflexota bacterium]
MRFAGQGFHGDTMRLLCVDPGPVKSAWVILDEDKYPVQHGLEENEAVLAQIALHALGCDAFVIEMIEGRGMPVGASVFETCTVIGHIERVWIAASFRKPNHRIYRRDVKLRLCGSSRAKDGNVRQAILDRYPATGGGKVPQVGVKSKPGPLFGIAKDTWAALAVGLAWIEMQGEKR